MLVGVLSFAKMAVAEHAVGEDSVSLRSTISSTRPVAPESVSHANHFAGNNFYPNQFNNSNPRYQQPFRPPFPPQRNDWRYRNNFGFNNRDNNFNSFNNFNSPYYSNSFYGNYGGYGQNYYGNDNYGSNDYGFNNYGWNDYSDYPYFGGGYNDYYDPYYSDSYYGGYGGFDLSFAW